METSIKRERESPTVAAWRLPVASRIYSYGRPISRRDKAALTVHQEDGQVPSEGDPYTGVRVAPFGLAAGWLTFPRSAPRVAVHPRSSPAVARPPELTCRGKSPRPCPPAPAADS
jgi:hypothetical protein